LYTSIRWCGRLYIFTYKILWIPTF
jgi:hypothetical protein